MLNKPYIPENIVYRQKRPTLSGFAFSLTTKHVCNSSSDLNISVLTRGIVFHSIIAMAVGLDSMRGIQDSSSEKLEYLGKAYRSISRNIQQDGTPSDSTVAAVMSMAILEDVTGGSEMTTMHMNALKTLIGLRGGIGVFERIPMLLQKIVRCVPASLRTNGSLNTNETM